MMTAKDLPAATVCSPGFSVPSLTWAQEDQQ